MLNILALKRIEPLYKGALGLARSVVYLAQNPNGNLLITACMQNYKKNFLFFYKSVNLIPNMTTPCPFFQTPVPLFAIPLFEQNNSTCSPQDTPTVVLECSQYYSYVLKKLVCL